MVWLFELLHHDLKLSLKTNKHSFEVDHPPPDTPQKKNQKTHLGDHQIYQVEGVDIPKQEFFLYLWTKKIWKYFALLPEGGRLLQGKMAMSFFNFESARGAKYREYGNDFLP